MELQGSTATHGSRSVVSAPDVKLVPLYLLGSSQSALATYINGSYLDEQKLAFVHCCRASIRLTYEPIIEEAIYCIFRKIRGIYTPSPRRLHLVLGNVSLLVSAKCALGSGEGRNAMEFQLVGPEWLMIIATVMITAIKKMGHNNEHSNKNVLREKAATNPYTNRTGCKNPSFIRWHNPL